MILHFDDINRLIKNAGIDELNEMQNTAIGEFDNSRDIILSAPTGSGKTIAFLAMLLKILPKNYAGTFGMIVTPSRELALQITSVFQKMKTGLKVTTCYGGHKREIEENNLTEAPTLIIGTPGRIGDHIRRGNISVETIQALILDEFDKSLELGFADEMLFIFDSLINVNRRILISATPLQELPSFLKLQDPVRLDFAENEDSKLKLNKLYYEVENKQETLLDALCTIGNRRTIIFINQKDTVKSLGNYLTERGIYTVSYHGSLEQQDRETAIAKFRNGTSLFLITTDLASRGLDISHVRFIIHYDQPDNEQVFTHRNGRTARVDTSGDAIIMLPAGSYLPDYVPENVPDFHLLSDRPVPDKTEWSTLYVSAGKKDKINKMDIAGFLMQKAGLKREDTGLIEVKDFYSFAAVRRSKMNTLLGMGKEQKIKNKKVKIAIAK